MENGGIQFSNSADTDLNPELVEFIRTHTGKMTALAKSDLESYIMLNRQFLNIGKALYLEGIGTLVKAKEGSIEFTPGDVVMERLDERMPETRKTSVFEENPRYDGGSGNGRKWAIFLGIAATLGIVIWGGWKWSQNNTSSTVTAETVQSAESSLNLPLVGSAQSTMQTPQIATAIDSTLKILTQSDFKFIILETNKVKKALARYNQLRELKKDIRMETIDSTTYKLYFLLNVPIKDTIRIRDSLSVFYATKVRVE